MISERENLLPAVFVIDDEAAMLHALKTFLDTWQIRVHVFSSAEAFLKSYRQEWTGCMLIDLRMPKMNGLRLLEEMQRQNIALPAVLMTAHGDEAVLQQAIEAGAIGILKKPFRVAELKEFLESQGPLLFRGDTSVGNG